MRLAAGSWKQRVVDGTEKNGSVETLPDVGNLGWRLLPRVPEMVDMNPLPLIIQFFTNSSLPETSFTLLAVVGLFGITRVKVGAFRVADGSPKQGATLVAPHPAGITPCWLNFGPAALLLA